MERMEMKSRGEGSCTRSPVSTVIQGNQRESLRSVWQNTNGLYRRVTPTMAVRSTKNYGSHQNQEKKEFNEPRQGPTYPLDLEPSV